MRAIMESTFSAAYLIAIILLGFAILKKARGRRAFALFGGMALLLGFGDAFHLIPRIYALNTVGVENLYGPLGFGTLVTSLTMTAFYIMLYHFYRLWYAVEGRGWLTGLVYLLGIARIILCLLPQNAWFSPNSPVSWGIYRNIPFAALGILVMICFCLTAKKHGDAHFRHAWLGVLLSFAFYIPVVLWAHLNDLVGLFMIPKTVAYVWVVWMGFQAASRKESATG